MELEKFSKDLATLAEHSEESSKIITKLREGNPILNISDYIKEMEKKSFYFRKLAADYNKPSQLIVELVN